MWLLSLPQIFSEVMDSAVLPMAFPVMFVTDTKFRAVVRQSALMQQTARLSYMVSDLIYPAVEAGR